MLSAILIAATLAAPKPVNAPNPVLTLQASMNRVRCLNRIEGNARAFLYETDKKHPNPLAVKVAGDLLRASFRECDAEIAKLRRK